LFLASPSYCKQPVILPPPPNGHCSLLLFRTPPSSSGSSFVGLDIYRPCSSGALGELSWSGTALRIKLFSLYPCSFLLHRFPGLFLATFFCPLSEFNFLPTSARYRIFFLPPFFSRPLGACRTQPRKDRSRFPPLRVPPSGARFALRLGRPCPHARVSSYLDCFGSGEAVFVRPLERSLRPPPFKARCWSFGRLRSLSPLSFARKKQPHI